MAFNDIIHKTSLHSSQETLHLHFRHKKVNSVQGNNPDLFWDSYEPFKYALWTKQTVNVNISCKNVGPVAQLV